MELQEELNELDAQHKARTTSTEARLQWVNKARPLRETHLELRRNALAAMSARLAADVTSYYRRLQSMGQTTKEADFDRLHSVFKAFGDGIFSGFFDALLHHVGRVFLERGRASGMVSLSTSYDIDFELRHLPVVHFEYGDALETLEPWLALGPFVTARAGQIFATRVVPAKARNPSATQTAHHQVPQVPPKAGGGSECAKRCSAEGADGDEQVLLGPVARSEDEAAAVADQGTSEQQHAG